MKHELLFAFFHYPSNVNVFMSVKECNTVSKIVRSLNISHACVTNTINNLIKLGYVSKNKFGRDNLLRYTEIGMELMLKMCEVSVVMNNALPIFKK